MRMSTGKVVAGQIIMDGEPFPEGSTVTVLAREGGESFDLDSVAEAALLQSFADADRGELIAAERVMRVFREHD